MTECSRCGNGFATDDLERATDAAIHYAMCFKCGHLLVVESGVLREATVEEWQDLKESGQLSFMHVVMNHIREARKTMKAVRRHRWN